MKSNKREIRKAAKKAEYRNKKHKKKKGEKWR